MDSVSVLRGRLEGRLRLAFGVSGPLATPLFLAREVERLVSAARDEGLSVFDTGPSYGAGEAERRLGTALHGDHDAFVMTKAGVTSSGLRKRARDFRPHAIVESVEGSLVRLKRDRIDVLWLHGPAQQEITDELLRALESLRQDGKVESFGITSSMAMPLNFAEIEPLSGFMATPQSGLEMAKRGQRDHVFFGIGCLANVASGPPMSRSGLWKSLRALVQKTSPADSTVEGALTHAYHTAACDLVITTTTKASRIKANSELCRKLTRTDVDATSGHEAAHENVKS